MSTAEAINIVLNFSLSHSQLSDFEVYVISTWYCRPPFSLNCAREKVMMWMYVYDLNWRSWQVKRLVTACDKEFHHCFTFRIHRLDLSYRQMIGYTTLNKMLWWIVAIITLCFRKKKKKKSLLPNEELQLSTSVGAYWSQRLFSYRYALTWGVYLCLIQPCLVCSDVTMKGLESNPENIGIIAIVWTFKEC